MNGQDKQWVKLWRENTPEIRDRIIAWRKQTAGYETRHRSRLYRHFHTMPNMQRRSTFFDNPPPPQNTLSEINQVSTFELIEVEFFSDVEPAASLNSTGFLFQGLVNIDAIDIDGSIFVMSASTSGGIQFLNVTDPESIRANSDRGSYKISSQVINPCTSCISDNAFPSDIFPIKIGGFTYALVTMFVSYDVGSLPDIFPTTGNLVQIRNITNLNDNGAVYESELNPTDGIVGASRIVGVEIDGFTYAIITSDLGIQIANITNVASPEVVFNITDGDAGYEKLGGALGITTAQIDGSHYALVAARTDDSVTIINITDPTSPSNVSLIVNNSEYPKLDGPSDITTTEINGTYYALVIYIHACICHCTVYTHRICIAQDCNARTFEDLICSYCNI